MFRMPPLSLYIHLPWCVRKCPYCDFNSHALRGAVPEADYVAALLADLDQDLPRVAARRIETVFFGGGTPSLFAPGSIAAILAGVRQRLACAPDWEVTLEANPGTIEHGRFRDYRAAGISRVSLGAQSFDDRHLQAIGRIHGQDEILRAVEELRAAGLGNFNLDLMYGLPDQTAAEALADVEQAVALQPAHVSHYELTLEPNTLFHARPPALPDEEIRWRMQEDCQAVLTSAGYAQYEVSAYARPGRECRHNLNYWRFGDYLGIGAGAHGKLTDSASGAITRLWKVKHPRGYLQHAGTAARIGGETRGTPEETVFEFMLNALRLKQGFTFTLFQHHTGLPQRYLQPGLAAAAGLGLLEQADDHWRPSAAGWRYLNDLQALFLPEPARQNGTDGARLV